MSKIIAITGAAAGLGRALARRLHQDGATIILMGRTLTTLEAAANELGERAVAIQCDVSSKESIAAAFEDIRNRFGSLDVLINNAAIYEPFTVAEARDDQILSILNTNLNGPIFACRAALHLMGEGAQIINLSSESLVKDFPLLSLYKTSKAGLEQFSTSLRTEVRDQGIRVTTVRAGVMYDETKAVSGWDAEVAMRFAKACAAAGIDLRAQASSHYSSVAEVIRHLLILPVDIGAPILSLEGFPVSLH